MNKNTEAENTHKLGRYGICERCNQWPIATGNTQCKAVTDARNVDRKDADKLAAALRQVLSMIGQPVAKYEGGRPKHDYEKAFIILRNDCKIARGAIEAALAAYEKEVGK